MSNIIPESIQINSRPKWEGVRSTLQNTRGALAAPLVAADACSSTSQNPSRVGNENTAGAQASNLSLPWEPNYFVCASDI